MEIEGSQKNNWDNTEWQNFFQWVIDSKHEHFSIGLVLFCALPDLFLLRWSLDQIKEVFSEFFRDPWFNMDQANWHFVMIFRALAQIRGVNSEISFQFFNSFVNFRVKPRCFLKIRDHIQTEVLLNKRDVNEVLLSMIPSFQSSSSLEESMEKIQKL